MRVFYALPLPPLILEHCLQLIHSMKKEHAFRHYRWTQPENCHVTLRFLAHIEKDQLDSINTRLEQNLNSCEPVMLSTRKLLLLPSRKPHLVALSIHLDEPLARLVRVINETLLTAEIPLEKRPFLGHITLGRSRDSLAHDDALITNVKTVEEKVDHLVLFHSKPSEAGSVYTPLKTFELKQ